MAKAKTKQETATKAKKEENIWMYALAALVGVVALYAAYYFLSNYVQTSFTAFKSSYIAAPKVAIALVYDTIPQYSASLQCSLALTQVVSRARSQSFSSNSIDFVIMNSTACVYQQGLGYPINFVNDTPENCKALLKSTPTIFLNYSYANYTVVTLNHMYIGGNNDYMTTCPIAAEFS